MTVPQNFKLLYTAAQIDERIELIGREVNSWAQQTLDSTQKDMVAIPILRGAIFFFADLVRRIECSVEVNPIRTWAYQNDKNVKREEFKINMEGVVPNGRSILLIDDICDSGRTLKMLCEAFIGAGAREVRTATLIRRALKEPTFQPDWVGFEYDGPEWFVGYGMEDRDRYRNLRDIYLIEQAN